MKKVVKRIVGVIMLLTLLFCNACAMVKGYKILTSEKTYIDINFDTLEILVPKDRITNTSDKLDIIVLANFQALPINKYY